MASARLAVLLLLSMPAAAQGVIIPVTTTAALDPSSGNKTAISDDSTLNVVFISGGNVMVTRSVGGGAWETPVAVSGTIAAPADAVIAAASDGTVAVAFVAATDLYYTYRTQGGTWSALNKPLSGDSVYAVAMTAGGTRIHIAANAGGGLTYVAFPIADPKNPTTEFVTLNTVSCTNPEIAFVSIVIAGLPAAERPYIAYSFVEDGTHNTNPSCTFHGYRAGVHVVTRNGDAADPWNMSGHFGATPVFQDVRAQSALVPYNLRSLSMASDASGEIFLAYSDAFCVSTTDCTTNSAGDPPIRTKLARYDAMSGVWSSGVLSAINEQVHLISRNASGANVRLSRFDLDGKTGCRFDEFDWHGAQRTSTASDAVANCTGHPQSLFFRHACGSPCDLRALYVEPLPLAITTFPACAATPLPDLTIGNFTAPATLYANGAFPFSFTVKNAGSADALAARVRIVLASGGKTITGIEKALPDPLPAGASDQTTVNLIFTPAAGATTWTATVTADPRDRVCEGNERNNQKTAGGSISAPPVCTFNSCTIGAAVVRFTPPFPVRFTFSGGVRGCSVPAGTTFQWYQRFGSGPWNAIPGATSSSVDLPDGAYEVRVDVTSGTTTCSPVYSNANISPFNIPMLGGPALALLAIALAAVGVMLRNRGMG